ncbi:hypothetical protein RJ640_000366 [Escallonia rubra]|uniref:KAT8 regulatory NSL complex subunit 2 n=1 Tax=Escallonia rubra TaxID=112253 RepID=A0AA88QK47_9ASTE|nr:hypothetical protein RJ640_000366 [Escallonia rubra]
MASSSHHHHHHQRHNLDRQCLLPPPPITKNPKTTTTTTPPPPTTPNPISPSLEDLYLSTSTHLTRQQVLRRRSHNLKQLAKVYTHHYWALMERLRAQYRDYVWRYGLSPFKEDEEREGAVHNDAVEGSKETRADSSNFYCAFYGCRLKAMALTSFCQLHILSDSRQQLYKPCEYVIKG